HVLLSRTWKPAATIRVVLPDGTRVNAKALGVNIPADSGMVKITDKPPKTATWPGAKDGKWPAVALGKSDALKSGQWLVAMGHPGGPKPDRRPPVRVGRYDLTVRERLVRDLAPFLRTECTLVGGDSGGPLFDLNGKLVGIHSQIRLALSHNLHVPVDHFRADWEKLLKGDILPPSSDAELGVELDDKADGVMVVNVTPNGPAATAGLKSGDVIVEFNDEKLDSPNDLLLLLALCDPGDRVEIRADRGPKTVVVNVILGRKSKKPAK
ncbi:MAG: S1C family serine protease, partial [Fimbriiglobus sp.]